MKQHNPYSDYSIVDLAQILLNASKEVMSRPHNLTYLKLAREALQAKMQDAVSKQGPIRVTDHTGTFDLPQGKLKKFN